MFKNKIIPIDFNSPPKKPKFNIQYYFQYYILSLTLRDSTKRTCLLTSRVETERKEGPGSRGEEITEKERRRRS